MQLPPLIALRFFEATARHLSVRRAAAELHVTPGAVSQQVRKLEDFLGRALFERLPRGLALTPAGQDYHVAASAALAIIGHATGRLLADKRRVVLVSCTPGFAVQWLVPRLQAFMDQHPGVDIHVSSTNRAVDLAAEGVHFAVRHGLGSYAGLQSEVLVADDLVPVCSPRLIAPRKKARVVDISSASLLHDEHRGDWRLWCEAHGMVGIDADKGIVFAHSNAAIEAAVAGRGFALVRRSLVVQELASRALLCVDTRALATPLAYHLVYPAEALIDPALRQFKDWIVSEGSGSGSGSSVE